MNESGLVMRKHWQCPKSNIDEMLTQHKDDYLFLIFFFLYLGEGKNEGEGPRGGEKENLNQVPWGSIP